MNSLGIALAVLGALLTLLTIVDTVFTLELPLQFGVVGPSLVVVGVGMIAYARRSLGRP